MDSRTTTRESGFALIPALLLAFIIAALSTSMLMVSQSSSRATARETMDTRLLYLAETGLQYNFVRMEVDPMYAVRDDVNFTANVTDASYEGAPETVIDLDGVQHQFQLTIQFRALGVPVFFPDRANPVAAWDEIRVECSAEAGPYRRSVVALYAWEIVEYLGGAIISDMVPTGDVGLLDFDQAKSGDIVFMQQGTGTSQHFVVGDIWANGQIRRYHSTSDYTGEIVTSNVTTHLSGASDTLRTGLAASGSPIPDYTQPGSAQQLFDFDRFEAAALAGAGQVYNSLADFADAANDANAAGFPLEGITVVHIDPAAEGANPQLVETGGGGQIHRIAAGINITGTLMFRYADGTDDKYTVEIRTPLNVNPADLSGLDLADPATYPSGYPTAYVDGDKHPATKDLTPIYENFLATDDLPAVMYDNGIIDLHGPVNVSGLIWTPSTFYVDNKFGELQYMNGAIFAGQGAYFETHASQGYQVIRYDATTVDNLTTFDNVALVLSRQGFAISR